MISKRHGIQSLPPGWKFQHGVQERLVGSGQGHGGQDGQWDRRPVTKSDAGGELWLVAPSIRFIRLITVRYCKSVIVTIVHHSLTSRSSSNSVCLGWPWSDSILEDAVTRRRSPEAEVLSTSPVAVSGVQRWWHCRMHSNAMFVCLKEAYWANILISNVYVYGCV